MKNAKAPPKKEGTQGLTARAARYLTIRSENPEIPKARALRLAGFSANTKPGQVDRAIAEALSNVPDIAQRIRVAMRETGAHVTRNLQVLSEIRDESQDAKARIAAVKVATEITGERMPEEISVDVTGDEEILLRIVSRRG